MVVGGFSREISRFDSTWLEFWLQAPSFTLGIASYSFSCSLLSQFLQVMDLFKIFEFWFSSCSEISRNFN
jgi:hypothetical protein